MVPIEAQTVHKPCRKCSWVTDCPKIKREAGEREVRVCGVRAGENKTHVRRRRRDGGMINDADTLKTGRHLATILSLWALDRR